MRRFFPLLAIFVLCACAASPAAAQDAVLGMESQRLDGVGWRGFGDIAFMAGTLLTLVVAAVLGAVIAYHPRTRLVIDTVEEAEAPKTTITYAVVGAVIGLMVVEYGMVVGFVVFGIGGLIRFRTTLASATETGRLIFVTLIGLSAGLDLPHLAVLATAFGFGLIYVLEHSVTYSIEIQGIQEDDIVAAADAYRSALKDRHCRIVSVNQNLSKGKVTVVFQTAPRQSRGSLDRYLEQSVPERLQGVINWEIA